MTARSLAFFVLLLMQYGQQERQELVDTSIKI